MPRASARGSERTAMPAAGNHQVEYGNQGCLLVDTFDNAEDYLADLHKPE